MNWRDADPTRSPELADPQGQPAYCAETDGRAGHRVGEVVVAHRDDADDDGHAGQVRHRQDQDAQRARQLRPRRSEQQHGNRGRQRDDRRGVPARVDDLADVGAVDQRLEQPVGYHGRHRDGQDGQHGAAPPPGEQAADDEGRGQRDGRNHRAGKGEPQGQGVMAGEPGDDRGVDGVVEPVRRVLAGEHEAEYGDEDRAAGQQDTRPRTGGGG